MFSNAKHWANNFAGMFLVAIVFFAVTLAVDRHSPSAAGGTLLWLFGLLGVASLVGWMVMSSRVGRASADRVLFSDR